MATFPASRPHGATGRGPVWDRGIVRYDVRIHYTGTTFANPVRVTFDRFYRPEVHIDRASDDPAGRPGPAHHRTRVSPLSERHLYRPIPRPALGAARVRETVQSDDVNAYLLYILIVLVVAYLVCAR